MKASIIIPCYNQGHLLDRSVKSALKQDFDGDYEIIIVDDGSVDNTKNCASALIGDNVKYLFKENGGTASARNAGTKLAKGEYIAYLDADDEYLPSKLSRSIEEISRYPNVGCVYSDYIERDTISNRDRVMVKSSFNRRRLLQSCIVSTNSLISRQAYDRVGGFDETIKGCEDYDMWLRICNAGYMITHIPETLFIYYSHGENKTATFDMGDWSKEEEFIKKRAMEGIYELQSTA